MLFLLCLYYYIYVYYSYIDYIYRFRLIWLCICLLYDYNISLINCLMSQVQWLEGRRESILRMLAHRKSPQGHQLLWHILPAAPQPLSLSRKMCQSSISPLPPFEAPTTSTPHTTKLSSYHRTKPSFSGSRDGSSSLEVDFLQYLRVFIAKCRSVTSLNTIFLSLMNYNIY